MTKLFEEMATKIRFAIGKFKESKRRMSKDSSEENIDPAKEEVKSGEGQNILFALMKLNEGIKSLPLKELWMLGSTLGGLMLLAYCWRIGYLPEFDLASLVATFFAIAAIGIVLVLILGLMFCLPTIFLANIPCASLDDKDPKHKKLGGVWAFLSAFVIIEALFLAEIKCPVLKDDAKLGGIVLSVTLFAILIGCFSASFISKNFKWGNIFKHFVTWSAWFFVFTILAIQIKSPSLFRQDSGWDEIGMLLLILFMSGFMQVIAARFYSAEERKAKTSDLTKFVLMPFLLLVSFVCAFALLSSNKLWVVDGALQAVGMKTYQDKRITLTVKSEACEAINLIERKACKLDQGSKIGVLEDIELLSKVGSTFFIQTKEKSRLVINKSDVVVWKEFRRGKSDGKVEPQIQDVKTPPK